MFLGLTSGSTGCSDGANLLVITCFYHLPQLKENYAQINSFPVHYKNMKFITQELTCT